MDLALQKPREHCPRETGSGEDAGSLGELGFRVPGAEDEVGADKGGGFEEPLEEADYVDLRDGGDAESAEGEEAPGEDRKREPVAAWGLVGGAGGARRGGGTARGR